jgi:hypothetical protein
MINAAAHPYVITVIYYTSGAFYGTGCTVSANSTPSGTAQTIRYNGGTPTVTASKYVFQQFAITYFSGSLVIYSTVSQFS